MITSNKRNTNIVTELMALLIDEESIALHHRFSVQNMIIVQMHLRDVFDDLVRKKVVSEQVCIHNPISVLLL